jgi:DNA-binding transcriptional LysR family regulator
MAIRCRVPTIANANPGVTAGRAERRPRTYNPPVERGLAMFAVFACVPTGAACAGRPDDSRAPSSISPGTPLVASTRGLALMPAYAKNLLPPSVVSRPLEGEAPTIDIAVGYSKSNTSPVLELFLSRIDELVGPGR